MWEKVDEHILKTYDYDNIENIFVNGDGGGWINTASSVLGKKVIIVLDSFHLQKYIDKATSHMGDSVGDARDAVRHAIYQHRKKEVKRIFGVLKGFAESESVLGRVEKSEQYILNHWDMIMNGVKYKGELVGCSAEGHVSHVLSERMSSRPLGWSKHGADQMSRLRAYRLNGGNMLELAKYQNRLKRTKQEKVKKYCTTQALFASERSAKREVEKYAGLINKSFVSGTAKKIAGIRLRITGL